jgi:hypothetical protein
LKKIKIQQQNPAGVKGQAGVGWEGLCLLSFPLLLRLAFGFPVMGVYMVVDAYGLALASQSFLYNHLPLQDHHNSEV